MIIWRHKETKKWLTKTPTLDQNGNFTYGYSDDVNEAVSIVFLPPLLSPELEPYEATVKKVVTLVKAISS